MNKVSDAQNAERRSCEHNKVLRRFFYFSVCIVGVVLGLYVLAHYHYVQPPTAFWAVIGFGLAFIVVTIRTLWLMSRNERTGKGVR